MEITLYDLELYWWFLVSLIGGLFVFMTFVQGGQTLLYTLAKNEQERDLLVNVLGRKWELTFTTLVMFGGALFAAFPLFYAVSFGGAYYVWMAILFCFIIQAVAYEYRKKPSNVYGEKFYEILLYINGSLGIFFIGVALATLFSGGNFVVDEMHLSHWTKSTYGLEALSNPFNVAFGLMFVFLARLQGALYFYNAIDCEDIQRRIKTVVIQNSFFFLILFLYIIFNILITDGLVYDVHGYVSLVHKKFFHIFLDLPFLFVAFLFGIGLMLVGIYKAIVLSDKKAIFFTGIATVIVVCILFLILGVDHSIYYPSLADIQSSLNIENSSGSYYTLSVMSVMFLLVPVVLAYIIAVWKSMDKEKMTIQEIESDPHHY